MSDTPAAASSGKIFLVLFLAIFLACLGNGLVVPLLPVYAHDMGASSFLIGMIFGVFSLSRMFMLPLVGQLSDSVGRKPFITCGLLIYFSVSTLFIFADSVLLLLLVRFIQGGASAMILPIAQAYAGDMTPPEQEGRIMGFIQLAIYGGLSAGPVLGGVAKDIYGIEFSFVLMGSVCLAGLILSQALLPPVKTEAAASLPVNAVKLRYFKILKNRRVVGLCAFELAYIMCIGSVWSFVPLIADARFQLPTVSIGVIITLSVLVSAAIIVPMGRLADRYNKKRLMVAGGSIVAASMFFLALVQFSWQLYAVSILIGIGGGIAAPSVMALAVVAGRESGGMASMMSLLAVANSFGMIAGPVLVGAIIDHLSARVGFMTSGTLMCLALAFSMRAIFGDKKQER
jgi:MFS transporter, DHA1 family, multidrug resistance protein